MDTAAARTARFGVFEFEIDSGTLSREGVRIRLQDQPRQVLRLLVERQGELVTREELRRALWPDDTFVDFETGLNVVINKIRLALDDSATSPRFIETFPRRGYRFLAPVIIVGERQPSPPAPDAVTSGSHAAASTSGWLQWLSVSVVVVLGGFAGGAAWRSASTVPSLRFDNVTQRLLTSGTAGRQAAISRDGRYIAYTLEEINRESLWVLQLATNARTELVPLAVERFGGVNFSPDGSHIYYSFYANGPAELYRIPVIGGQPSKLGVGDIDSAVTFSPDGNQMAFLQDDRVAQTSRMFLSQPDGSRLRVLAEQKDPGRFALVVPSARPSWSPDGKVILAPIHTPSGIATGIVDTATGTVTTLGDQRWHALDGVEWLPDQSGFLAVGIPDIPTVVKLNTQIWHVDYPAGTIRRITNDLRDYYGVSLTTDARLFIAASTEHSSSLWLAPADRISEMKELSDGGGHSEGVSGIGWAPDGHLIYTSTESGNMDLWDLDVSSGARRQLTTDLDLDVSPSVSPDGKTIAFVSERGGTGRIWVMDRLGANAHALTTGPNDVAPAWAPDGSYIMFNRRRASPLGRIVSFPGGEEGLLFEGAAAHHPMANTFRPNSISKQWRIAGYSTDKNRWQVAVGSRTVARFKLLDAFRGWQPQVEWSPDGLAVDSTNALDHDNVWRFPVDGGTPSRLTNFTTLYTRKFAWSPDGKQLALSRGKDRLDVVLFTDTIKPD